MDEDIKTLEELAATIAHEVKNPLAVLSASLDILETDDGGEKFEAQYRLMRKEIAKIHDMMIDFTNITKPCEDIKDIVYTAELLQELVREFSIREKRIVFTYINNSEEDFAVLADKRSLKTVFSNLLKNAVEAMAEIVTVETIRNKDKLEVSISDNGCGLRPGADNILFNKCFTTKDKGSGMGLMICRRLLERQGGHIEIANSLHGGVTALVILPLYENNSD